MNGFELLEQAVGRLDPDDVARADDAASEHDAHDAGLAHKLAVGCAIKNRIHQACLKIVDLLAGVTKPRKHDYRIRPDMKPSATGQGQ